jgi:protein MAK16
MVGIKKKLERRDRARETKALSAAKLERSIEAELLSRLKSKAYGDAPLNVNEDVWRQVLERERLGDEEDMEELEDEDSGEEDEDMDEDEMEEEMEGGEREFVEDDSDFDEDDEEDDMEDYSGEEVRRLSFNVPSAFQRYVSLADIPVGCV